MRLRGHDSSCLVERTHQAGHFAGSLGFRAFYYRMFTLRRSSDSEFSRTRYFVVHLPKHGAPWCGLLSLRLRRRVDSERVSLGELLLKGLILRSITLSGFCILKKHSDDFVAIECSDAHRVGTFWKEHILSFSRVQKLFKTNQGARRTSTKREAYDEIFEHNIR